MKTMNRTARTLGLVGALAILVSAPGLGQGPGRGSGGWGPGSTYGRLYNAAQLDTVSGSVVAVRRITPLRGMHQGVELLVASGADTAAVHLGPDWYLDHQDVRVAAGDVVKVVGSAVTIEGKPVILAAELTRGSDRLKLRDLQTGAPAWAGSCPR